MHGTTVKMVWVDSVYYQIGILKTMLCSFYIRVRSVDSGKGERTSTTLNGRQKRCSQCLKPSWIWEEVKKQLKLLGWHLTFGLTFILLMWRIKRAPNNVSKWKMRFNSAFKGLICYTFQSAIYKHKVDAFRCTKVCYFLFSMQTVNQRRS